MEVVLTIQDESRDKAGKSRGGLVVWVVLGRCVKGAQVPVGTEVPLDPGAEAHHAHDAHGQQDNKHDNQDLVCDALHKAALAGGLGRILEDLCFMACRQRIPPKTKAPPQ